MRIHSPQPLTALQRAASVALLVVFVLAQTLGWMHRGLHASPAPALHSYAAHAATEADARWISGLFSHDAGALDCKLYDGLGQAGCAPAPVLALPILPPAHWLAAAFGDFVARWAALFDARGPPSSR